MLYQLLNLTKEVSAEELKLKVDQVPQVFKNDKFFKLNQEPINYLQILKIAAQALNSEQLSQLQNQASLDTYFQQNNQTTWRLHAQAQTKPNSINLSFYLLNDKPLVLPNLIQEIYQKPYGLVCWSGPHLADLKNQVYRQADWQPPTTKIHHLVANHHHQHQPKAPPKKKSFYQNSQQALTNVLKKNPHQIIINQLNQQNLLNTLIAANQTLVTIYLDQQLPHQSLPNLISQHPKFLQTRLKQLLSQNLQACIYHQTIPQPQSTILINQTQVKNLIKQNNYQALSDYYQNI